MTDLLAAGVKLAEEVRLDEERSDELATQFTIEPPLACLSGISIPKLHPFLLSSQF